VCALLAALDAERVEQILVELEPDCVIRVDERLREPLCLTGPQLGERCLQTGAIAAVALESGFEIGDDGLDLGVQLVQLVDDALVVGRVGVIVDRGFVFHLPRGADTQQIAVQIEETLVRVEDRVACTARLELRS
jgi:hypothetical protein